MSSTTTTPGLAQPQMPAPPTLFLFDKITAFLNANATPPLIRVLALSNPKGELLAHSTNNSIPASVLRRQCAVAASIFPPVFEGELLLGDEGVVTHDGNGNANKSAGSRPSSSMSSSGGGGSGAQAVTVTIDDGSVVVIRRLSCGVLFISTGGGETQAEEAETTGEGAASPTVVGGDNSSTATSNEGGGGASTTAMMTTASGLSKADVLVLRRRVEELARLLDGQLSTLYVPEDGVGIFSAPVSRFYGRVPPWRSG